ncbi:MAG: FliG C-terminal domain-containing protein [Gemmataceae bacterium]
MNGLEKAAVLLKNLAPELAPKVLSQLAQPQAERLRTQMLLLEQTPPDRREMMAILREIEQIIFSKAGSPLRKSEEEASAENRGKSVGLKVDTAVIDKSRPAGRNAGSARIDHVVDDDLAPTHAPPPVVVESPPRPVIPDGSRDPLGAIKLVPTEHLAMVLKDEGPRTICLLLNYLDVNVAGGIYKLLPTEVRREVSVQFALQPVAPPAVLERIALAVLEKCRTTKEIPQSSDPLARVRKIANLLRQLERNERMEMLTALEGKDPETANGVKDQLYQFEDLMLVDNSSIQKLLAELDTKNLALALKGAADGIRDKLLNNLSKRAQETLGEEIALLGNVPPSKVEQARKVILEALQALDARGELVMTS